MVRLNKIYTRTGDSGETSLVGGTRVSKHSLRPEAFGEIDELNSILGITRAHLRDSKLKKLVEHKALFLGIEPISCLAFLIDFAKEQKDWEQGRIPGYGGKMGAYGLCI